MKLHRFLAALLACFLLLPPAGAEEKPPRTLTLMIYMCGSNLESEYGSATADIREMVNSGFSPERLNLLVMMGGSDQWVISPEISGTVILEVQPGRARVVQRLNQMNMGSAETLTELLDFGQEQYRADDYALIFWDHGGGPLEGVCWDELFSMDNLSLSEVTKGISRAYLRQKLSWIGFDACLMGSAEVAAALAPYAEYMIASQETEPALGWDYSFLPAADGDGRKTGRAVVDSYFAAQPDSRDALTMSCVDLSKMEAVQQAMDSFFSGVEQEMTGENFRRFSSLRSEAPSFGGTVKAAGQDGYDLVDLGELIALYGAEETDLARALREAVVCSRASGTTAGGLSVYHPYTNKRQYLSSWRNDYRRLTFSSGYTRYLEHFGSELTGTHFVDWSRMRTEETPSDAEGVHPLSLRLTEAQRAEALSAELMVMDGSFSDSGTALFPLSVEEAEISEDGTVSAEYRGRAMYVTDAESGILTGPVSFTRLNDGKYYLIEAWYTDYSTSGEKKSDAYVLYYCLPDPETGELKIERTYVYDRVSETYTNRLAFTEKGYTQVVFMCPIRYLPDPEKAMPGFADWELYNGYGGRVLSLPCDWHLRFSEQWESGSLYAFFQVTDLQQNEWASLPVPIWNHRYTALKTECSLPAESGLSLEAEAVLRNTRLNPLVEMTLRLKNDTDHRIKADQLPVVLNGTRTAERRSYLSLEPGETEEIKLIFQEEALTGLAEISEVTIPLELRNPEEKGGKARPFTARIRLEGCDVSSFAPKDRPPLCTLRNGSVTWQAVSLSQNAEGKVEGLLRLLNEGPEAFDFQGVLALDGIHVGTSVTVCAAPGTDVYVPFTMENRVTVSDYALSTEDKARLYLSGIDHLLERCGRTEIREIELYPGLSAYSAARAEQKEPLRLRLPEGIPLRAAGDFPEERNLLEADGLRADLVHVFTADDGLALGLILSNDTDETVLLEMRSPAVNGTDFDSFELPDEAVLPPHARTACFLVLRDREGRLRDQPLREVTFSFRQRNADSEPVRLRFPEGARFGVPGGEEIDAGRIGTEAAFFANRPLVLEEEIRVSSDPVFSIRAVAPVSAERAGQIESGSVSLCVVREKQTEGQAEPVREIRDVSVALMRKEGSEWIAELSGLAVMTQGHFLRTGEEQISENRWILTPDMIYFYQDSGTCRPTGAGLDTDGGFSDTSSVQLTAEVTDGKLRLLDSSVELSRRGAYLDPEDKRTNRELLEIAEAAIENRVYVGTDRMANWNTLDYDETILLSLEEPVRLEVVPNELVPENGRYLKYVLQFTDGSREDILTDLYTGEILEKTVSGP